MANQTIIQAAGQRYAPTRIDYSGYIQGIASITTALVEKRKQNLKKKNTFGKLTLNAEHPHLDDNMVFLRDNVYGQSIECQNLVQVLFEKIAKNTAHPGEAKHLRSFEHMKQREYVKDMRYPARINAHTMEKEYPGMKM